MLDLCFSRKKVQTFLFIFLRIILFHKKLEFSKISNLLSGVKSAGPSAWLLALLPYVFLTALLARALTLEGKNKFSSLAPQSVPSMAERQMFPAPLRNDGGEKYPKYKI